MKSKEIRKIIILGIISILIVGIIYVKRNLEYADFESLWFYSTSNIVNADLSLIYMNVLINLPFVILFTICFYIIFYGLKIKKYNLDIPPIKHLNKYKNIYISVIFISLIIILLQSVKTFNYVVNMQRNSDFIEKNYIDPKNVNVTFDENKKNLILIFVESLENSLFTKEQGGIWDYEIIPELYDLLNSNNSINFNPSYGMYMIQGASYTTSSIITNTTGVPLKIGYDRQGFSSENFMSGSYALGDLLKDNGYYNEVISGASTAYGGLDYYFKQHGDFNIIDIDTINNYGYSLEKNDYGKWGFNDNYLFELAKERLDVITKENKTFNLQLITIDTHFTDGYVGDYSVTKFKRQYENAYATTSKLIQEFIDYLKEQSYYDDTAIVIVGDHLLMQSNFVNNRMIENRTIYNCILNSSTKTLEKSNRIYTALDTYPTIISAIGGKIEGNKLGLGVNLFSNQDTLAEQYGVDKLDTELKKKSNFYNKNILN